jgi:hypothetical protein
MTEGQSAPSDDAKRRREQRWTFWGLLAFSVPLIGGLIRDPPTFATWGDWIRVGGAIFVPILAITSFVASVSAEVDQGRARQLLVGKIRETFC